MKKIYTLLAILLCVTAHSQKNDDRTIIANLPDSVNARSAVLKSLIKNEFTIKDLESRDTVITYPTDVGKMFVVIVAVISGNVIQLTGGYSHKKVEYTGSQDKHYIPIRYYGASKTWDVLNKIAKDTGGIVSYGK